ncbi:MAG: AAA family ATPase [Oscillospiraceae bacterium]|nr:AAA family ATPase [Oscillospiraceae bacterium]
MRIHELYLKNFRGFADREFKFHERLTLIVGENGSGKTSLLEGLCVALGGWLYGFDYLESQDKRNFIKADRRKIVGTINNALLEQIPVSVGCTATLPSGEVCTWSRSLTNLNGRTTHGDLTQPRKITEPYNRKISAGDDGDIILPIVAYYSAARLWNDPIQWERTFTRDKVRLDGYKRAISYSNSISDAMRFADRLAFLAYHDEDKDAFVKMNAIINAIKISLESASPGANVYYDKKIAEFCIKNENGEITPYSLFSDGYRFVTCLIIDVCHRIMTLNPHLDETAIQKTSGVVLIDEIELHLHPRWQQKVIDDLTRIFPEVQFIITTHTPLVVQSVKKENLLILDGNDSYYPSHNVYGRDVNSILEFIMGVRTRPEEIDRKLSDIYELINLKELKLAAEKADDLEIVLGDSDPELTSIRVTLDIESLEA